MFFRISSAALLRRWLAPLALAGVFVGPGIAWAQLDDDFNIDDLTDVAPPDTTTTTPSGQPAADGAAAPGGEEETIDVEAVFANAEQLRSNGNHGEAIRQYGIILRNNPQYSPAALGMAQSFIALDDRQTALSILTEASRYGSDPALIVERGRIQMDLGTLDEAESAMQGFQRVLLTDPTNPEYLYLLGKAQLRVARAMAQENNTDFRTYIPLAIDSLDRAIKFRDDHAPSYYERGSAYTMGGNSEDALSDFQRAIELDDTEPNYKAHLALAHFRRGSELENFPNADQQQITQHYRAAIQAMDTFLEEKRVPDRAQYRQDMKDMRPDDVPVATMLLQRATTLLELANRLPEAERVALYQKGIADCNRVLELDERASGALYQRAIIERMAGDLDTALATLHDAAQLGGESADLLLRRGIIYYHQGELSMALQDFVRAHESMPIPDGRAAFWAGAVHARLGDALEAIRNYTAAVRENPNYAPAYSNRALAYMVLGDYERAVQDFDRVLILEGDNATIRARRDQAARLLASE